jgi:hypothetical protein
MWLTKEEEKEFDRIRDNCQLTKQELEYIRTYGGFKERCALNSNGEPPGSILINKLQGILEKYGKER